jgi:polyisoprenoid-binding protein YceI
VKHHLTMLFALLAVASLTTVNVNNHIEPKNYLEYIVSHGGVSFSGRAPTEHVALSFEDKGLELEVVVNPTRFDSNNLMRDGLARAAVFETQMYPRIVFTAAAELTALEAQQLELAGTLYMHGGAKDVTIPVRLKHDQQTVTATGTFAVKLSDYNMKRPQVGGLFINDEVSITFSISATLDEVTL